MRQYRVHLDITDSTGREWEFDEVYSFHHRSGELLDRKWMTENVPMSFAKVLVEDGVFFGATIGQLSIELIGSRQPGWSEVEMRPAIKPSHLRLVTREGL